MKSTTIGNNRTSVHQPAKAQSLADRLRAKIDEGVYPSGAWLPSERELAEEHQVDRSTVRRALGILAERHLVILTAGTGAQVPAASSTMRRAADDVTRQVGTWRGFHVSATRAGHQPFTETTVSEVDADVDVGRGLGVPTGTPVLRRARRQGIVGGPPVQLSTSYLLETGMVAWSIPRWAGNAVNISHHPVLRRVRGPDQAAG